MGRLRKSTFGGDKENGGPLAAFSGGAATRFSRPWDNQNGPPAPPDGFDANGFASLRVEHFVDVNIASRAAMFENTLDDDAPVKVGKIAARFEQLEEDEIRPGSLVTPWPEPLRPSNAMASMSLAAFIDKDPSPTQGQTPLEAANAHLPAAESPIKTLLGHRSVKPILLDARPPTFVGLPIPGKNPARSSPAPEAVAPRPPSPPSPGPMSPMQGCTAPGLASPLQKWAEAEEPTADENAQPVCCGEPPVCIACAPEEHEISVRRQSRFSVRMTPEKAGRQSTRMPSVSLAGFAPPKQPELPLVDEEEEEEESEHESAQESEQESENESENGSEGEEEEQNAAADEPANPASLDFSDPDTFDTFGSLNLQPGGDDAGDIDPAFDEFATPEQNPGALPGLVPVSPEHPTFPDMTPFGETPIAAADPDDDDGDVFDVPSAMIAGSGGGKALRELQTASVKAGNDLAEQVRQMREGTGAGSTPKRSSLAQGELEMRSRFFRRWNTRYASVIDHAFFGRVLFLYILDSRQTRQGSIGLKSTKMVVLADSSVKVLDGSRKAGPSYFFELKTTQRKYVFACLDDEQRRYWMSSLSCAGRGGLA